jgi:hypothetical protein
MRNSVTGSKAQRDHLRRTMREDGCTLDQIAIEMMVRWGFRPRQAWRHAHGKYRLESLEAVQKLEVLG